MLCDYQYDVPPSMVDMITICLSLVSEKICTMSRLRILLPTSDINHICFITMANEIKAQTIIVINDSDALFLWVKRGQPHPTSPSLLSFSK